MTQKRERVGSFGWKNNPSARSEDKETRALLFLDEASKLLLANIDFDQTLHSILTAITLGEGLGFNRAMVFLFDKEKAALKGEMAIGPDDPGEAQRIWTALGAEPGERLSDRIKNLDKRSEVSHLNQRIRQMIIPLNGSRCLFERTFREERSFVESARCEAERPTPSSCPINGHEMIFPACHIHRQIIPNDVSHDTVSVPLWGRGRVIGTILADNAFNQRPIEMDDIRLLEVFAKHAGLAIEHARVVHEMESSSPEPGRSQDVLVQNEKMAALRQMADDVAHAIRNPLVSIGGLARRLDKTLEPNASAKKYTETMIKETTRLEGILDGITDYSTDVKPLFGMHDLNTIVRDALTQVGEIRKNADIQMAYELEPNLPEICCDHQKIKQSLLHILLNAADAMNGQGTLHVRTYSMHRNSRNWVAAEITDSGGGISQEILQNIFHPFFSTRSKDPGLGLAICHKIVTSHQGSIDVDNRPGQGVRVVITLPQDQR